MYAKKRIFFSKRKVITADGTEDLLQEKLKSTRKGILVNIKGLFL